MTKKSGRVEQLTDDRKAGIVKELDGTVHPFKSDRERELDEPVLFELDEEDIGDGVKAKFAKLD